MASSTTEPKVSTRELLIRVAVEAIDEMGEPNIRLDYILNTSGVSVSSLYHYFGNLRGLIDAANIARFNRVYLIDIETTRAALEKIRTRDEFRTMVISIIEDIFLPARGINRRRRLLAFSGLDNNPEFVEAISQAHRANALATSDILASAQSRQFVSADFDPISFGVWLSTQAFGLAVTEIMNDDVLNDMWREQTLSATLHLLGLND